MSALLPKADIARCALARDSGDHMEVSKMLSGRVIDTDPRPMSVDVDRLIG